MKQNGEAEDNQQLSSSLAVCTSSLRDRDSNLNGLSFLLQILLMREYEKRMNAKNAPVLSKKLRGNSRSELNTSDFGAI